MVNLTGMVGLLAENCRRCEVSSPMPMSACMLGAMHRGSRYFSVTRWAELLVCSTEPWNVLALAAFIGSATAAPLAKKTEIKWPSGVILLAQRNYSAGDPTLSQVSAAAHCTWHHKNASEAAWPGSCLPELCISQPAALNDTFM